MWGVSDGYLSLPVGSEAYFLVILYNVYLKKLEFTVGVGGGRRSINSSRSGLCLGRHGSTSCTCISYPVLYNNELLIMSMHVDLCYDVFQWVVDQIGKPSAHV